MNTQEITKALEIIKQPITVNCKEYKFFDQENYDKLVAVYDNCLWFSRNLEQIQQTVDFLTKRENKLQTIEQMYKSGSVDLDKLRKIVLEEE